jgi:hypothetical protein
MNVGGLGEVCNLGRDVLDISSAHLRLGILHLTSRTFCLQRAASGQLKRISPRDLSSSPGSSPASSRAASMGTMR